MSESEIWKPVVGYEGFYEISNLGRLKSLRCWAHGKICYLKSPKIIKTFINPTTGYECFVFGEWGRFKTMRFNIHRLVAMSFIPNPYNLPEIDHVDGNKLNNRVDNLEWVTRETNIQRAFKLGLIPIQRGEECHNAKLNNELVLMIFNSKTGPRKLSRELGLSYSSVNGIKNGSSWNHITGLPKKKWKKT